MPPCSRELSASAPAGYESASFISIVHLETIVDTFFEYLRGGYVSTMRQPSSCETCQGAGYLRIGPGLDPLEQEAAGLGAAFYWTLVRSLCRVMRI